MSATHDQAKPMTLRGQSRVVRQTIELGRNNGLEAEVVAGLNEGDVVILHPSDKVAEGVRISPR